MKKRKASPALPSESISDSENDTFSWSGDPIKCTSKKKFYAALRIGNGDVIHIKDNVIMAPQDPDDPPYIARVDQMWHESSSAGGPGEAKIKAMWFFRPSDIPTSVANSLPGGGPVEDEVFFSQITDDNDVRTLLRRCHILACSTTSSRRALRSSDEDTFYCRYEYLPTTQKFRPYTIPTPTTVSKPPSSKLLPGSVEGRGVTSEEVLDTATVPPPPTRAVAAQPPSSPPPLPPACPKATDDEVPPPTASSLPPPPSVRTSMPLSVDLAALSEATTTTSHLLSSPRKGTQESSRVGSTYQAEIPACVLMPRKLAAAAVDDCRGRGGGGGAKAHENGSASPLAVATLEVRGGSTTTATTTTPPPLVACDASSADCPKENSPTETLTSSSVVPLTGGDGHVLKVETTPKETAAVIPTVKGVPSSLTSKVLQGHTEDDDDATAGSGGGGADSNAPTTILPPPEKESNEKAWGDEDAENACLMQRLWMPEVIDAQRVEHYLKTAHQKALETLKPGCLVRTAPGIIKAAQWCVFVKVLEDKQNAEVITNIARNYTNSRSHVIEIRHLRLCGYWCESKALHCLYEMHGDVEKALEAWALDLTHMKSEGDKWRNEEVALLTSALTRFDKDLHAPLSFIPGKTAMGVNSFYYHFLDRIKDMDKINRLFKLKDSIAGHTTGLKRMMEEGGIENKRFLPEDRRGRKTGLRDRDLAASRRFLDSAMASLPADQHRQLIKLLVSFDRKDITMTQLISEVMLLLEAYPNLVSGFHPFLPSNYVMTGPTSV